MALVIVSLCLGNGMATTPDVKVTNPILAGTQTGPLLKVAPPIIDNNAVKVPDGICTFTVIGGKVTKATYTVNSSNGKSDPIVLFDAQKGLQDKKPLPKWVQILIQIIIIVLSSL